MNIDIHAHWYPAEWLKLYEKDGPKEGAFLTKEDGKYKVTTPTIVNMFTDQFVEVDGRIAQMDRRGIDVHVLSLTAPMVYWASSGLGAALSQCFNDAASAAHLKHPKRLLWFAMLPLQDPKAALKELERAAKLPGMRGVYLATNINGTDLDDPALFDVYGRVEELGWGLWLHPVDTIGSRDRLAKYYLKNLLGNPFDNAIAAARLVFGGVMDRFPKLEVNLPHAGGAFPSLIGRLDHGTRVRPELKHMKQPPSAYLRRFTYDTIGHDDRINANLVKQVGADRVMLGSDYCFDMGVDDPLATVMRIPGVSEEEKNLIAGGNAARLLRL